MDPRIFIRETPSRIRILLQNETTREIQEAIDKDLLNLNKSIKDSEDIEDTKDQTLDIHTHSPEERMKIINWAHRMAARGW